MPRLPSSGGVREWWSNGDVFSVMIASLVRTWGWFLGIGQVRTMPLFFASNASSPLALLPPLAAGDLAPESADL